MEQAVEMFSKRFAIQGLGDRILFTFRVLRGEYGVTYKVRTLYPESDFNMQVSTLMSKFVYSDPSTMPAWITSDKSLQAKISDAIDTAELQ